MSIRRAGHRGRACADYAWGSPTAIPRLLGRRARRPARGRALVRRAPGDPSPARAARPRRADRRRSGAAARRRPRSTGSAPQLPFLLKVLAAERALSIQVHPTREQARGRLRRRGAPPACPATRRTQLPRPQPQARAAVRADPVRGAVRVPAGASRPSRCSAGLAAAGARLRSPSCSRVRSGCAAAFTGLLDARRPGRAGARGPAERAAPDGPLRGALLAAQDFPGDIGVVLTRAAQPRPLGAGRGDLPRRRATCTPTCAAPAWRSWPSSDNVLRCGLTPKHVDVAELLRITDFTELADPRCAGRATARLRGAGAGLRAGHARTPGRRRRRATARHRALRGREMCVGGSRSRRDMPRSSSAATGARVSGTGHDLLAAPPVAGGPGRSG